MKLLSAFYLSVFTHGIFKHMEILNLAASALFESLDRQSIDRELLLKGTNLKLDFMLDVKKKHTWTEFVKMYDNAAELLGKERAAREIAYHGLYNDNLGTLRKIATGLLDVKAIYWFLGTVACRHLFKDFVKFKYTKIKFNQVKMEISIAPELEDCPLLLETYIYLFENVPTLLGLPKATVNAEISPNKAAYTIRLVRTSYILYLFSKLTRSMTGYTNAVMLMEELETQSLQMAKLLEEKSELVRIMSHDISNISMAIDISLAKVIKKGNLQEEDQSILTKAKKSSEQLSVILRNVQKLEISQIRGVVLEEVDINEVFKSSAEHFKDQMDAKNINLVIQNDLPAHMRVTAEKSSLELGVLSNLLSNAIKFSSEGSDIVLGAHQENDSIVITVEDQGRGMSPEDRKNLFVKKLRKSTLGTKGEIGTGLGLGIVNTYVRLYGGDISAHQNFPMGTIFKISIPTTTHIPVLNSKVLTDKHTSSTTLN